MAFKLYDFRNTGTHKNIVNVRVEVNLHEDVNSGKGWSSRPHIFFKDDPDSNLEIVRYLEDRIQKMKDLIASIINKEPSLSLE